MLELIRPIINYIPRNSYDDMVGAKIASIVAIETKVSESESGWDLGGLAQLNGIEDTQTMTELTMKVVENQVYEENIEKSSHPTDIFKAILDRFKQDYKYGKNYDVILHTIESSKLLDLNYILGKIFMASNKIYSNSRNGPGNIAIIPEKYKDKIDLKTLHNFEVIYNPLEDDKIYVISKPKDDIHFKYHLITDSKIPSNRELKINKLLNSENREINYCILPIHGFAETIIVFDLV